jgi:hypothetical protein
MSRGARAVARLLDGAPACAGNLVDLDADGRTTRPAGRQARVRTPEQVARDRARSRAWHARQRALVAQVQAATPAGRRPVAQPDATPDAPLSSQERTELEALRAEVAELRATLAGLEARIDNDRQRSRRNARRRRQRSASGRLPLSSRVPAREQHGRHGAGTPQRYLQLIPPRVVVVVSSATYPQALPPQFWGCRGVRAGTSRFLILTWSGRAPRS